MKKFFSFVFSFVLIGIVAYGADYTVKSKHILNPDLNIHFVRENADFWINSAYDPEFGGFYSNISREGVPYQISGKSGMYFRKSFISHTRLAYSFTKAFMLTGDEVYLDFAHKAYDFLVKYAWDKQFGGWYSFGLRNGDIDNTGWWNPNESKWGFQQHYAMLGIIALYEATHDPAVKEWVDKGMLSLSKMWDLRPAYQGYYENADLNWINMRGKGFTPTVDGITTNAELLYLITQAPEHKERLMQLADNIVEKMLIHMDHPSVKLMYPESYNSDWGINFGNTEGSIGHFIKTAWCLTRAYICDTTKNQYKNAAIRILNQAWDYNVDGVTIWDHVNGAPFNAIDIRTGKYYVKDKDNNYGTYKDYWTVEQGFTGPMINYYITGNPTYLQMADESLDFYMNHFVDKLYGETFSTLHPDGSVKSTVKGDDFKAGYHSNELGYYAYLYSSLYYLKKPATLYYMFQPQETAQTISLTPIPMIEGELKIQSVTLNGSNFTSFDPSTRTLNIAANQGGKFRVTFETSQPTAVYNQWADNIQVYPTLTKNTVNLYNISDVSTIRVSDLSGKIVLSIQNRSDNTVIDLTPYSTGVYFITLENNRENKVTKKVIKQN